MPINKDSSEDDGSEFLGAMIILVVSGLVGIVGAVLASGYYGMTPTRLEPKMEACKEFNNEHSCRCWVANECGTDFGRAANRNKNEKK